MDLTPTSDYMQSKIRENHPWWKAIAELVDNSVDSGATTISIDFSDGFLIVTDDGRGVRDVKSLAQLGNHDDQGKPQNRIGIYGIGCKEAWLTCGPVMHVRTVHDGQKTEFTFDIEQIIRNNWKTPTDPVSKACKEKTGTSLKFQLWPKKTRPTKDCRDKLQWLFTPAIRAGQRIRFLGSGLSALATPPLTDAVECRFDVDGHEVEIAIGRVAEAFPNGPFWLVHKHRVIDQTGIGTCQYSSSGIGGVITLHGDSWTPMLGKNKDQLTQYVDELEQAIFHRIEPLLKDAAKDSEMFESQLLVNDLQEMLNGILSDEKTRQGKGKRGRTSGKAGTVEPTGNGAKHRTAQEVHQDGEVSERDPSVVLPRRGVRMKMWDGDGLKIGKFDANEKAVYLDASHPYIRMAADSGDRLCLLQAVAIVLADYEVRHEGSQRILRGMYGDFCEAVSELLRSVKEVQHAVT